ncbi:MAG TPA: carbohydrate ABC transporter permease [Clostridiales bacterium]|nr:carbohydrate ABC transporter permease [Clostridiales bacterium]
MANFQGTKINPKRFSRSQIKFYMILLPLSIFMILPVVLSVSQSLKPMGEIYQVPPKILVKNPTLDNFRSLFALSGTTGVPMSRYLLNSMLISIATVVINLFVTITAAYVFSKKNFKMKKTLFQINQMALMFVATSVTVPRYLVVMKMGLMNSWMAHILPLIAMPVGLFLVKQNVDQIPNELIEAAVMDGAKDLKIITKVIIPLTKPALATSVVFTFQAVWGAVEASNNYITNDTMRTLAFYLNSLSTNNAVAAAGMQAAASVIMFLPNLIIFIFMQSRVMNTMSHSGIK